MHGKPLPWQPAREGLSLTVRLTPKGGRDAIEGMAQLADGRPVLKARVRQAPEDGAANTALRVLLADALGIASGRIELISGASARLKTLTIQGEAAALAVRLADHISSIPRKTA